jgi:hypothetical protein
MNDTDTAGQRLVAMLDEGLPSGVVWDASERVVLSLIEESADRAAVLAALVDAEVARPECNAHRCCELAAEIRQLQAAIAKMVATGLDPRMENTAKSVRHQHAANTRWHPGGA